MLGLFSGELIFGGAYYWKEFCISKWVGHDKQKQPEKAGINSPWAHFREGLLLEGFLCHRFGGLIFGRDFLFFFFGGGGGLFLEVYGICFCTQSVNVKIKTWTDT